MNAHPPYLSDRFDDDEYLRDFKRPEPVNRRIGRERVMNMVRNARHLGRRSLSHLLLRLQNSAQHKTRKPKEQSHEPQ